MTHSEQIETAANAVGLTVSAMYRRRRVAFARPRQGQPPGSTDSVLGLCRSCGLSNREYHRVLRRVRNGEHRAEAVGRVIGERS